MIFIIGRFTSIEDDDNMRSAGLIDGFVDGSGSPIYQRLEHFGLKSSDAGWLCQRDLLGFMEYKNDDIGEGVENFGEQILYRKFSRSRFFIACPGQA